MTTAEHLIDELLEVGRRDPQLPTNLKKIIGQHKGTAKGGTLSDRWVFKFKTSDDRAAAAKAILDLGTNYVLINNVGKSFEMDVY